MGPVLQFVRYRHDDAEHKLLQRLTSDVQCLWRGGWAERGHPDGVVVFRNQHVIGVWNRCGASLCYVPIAYGAVTLTVATVDEAFACTIKLLGPLPE